MHLYYFHVVGRTPYIAKPNDSAWAELVRLIGVLVFACTNSGCCISRPGRRPVSGGEILWVVELQRICLQALAACLMRIGRSQGSIVLLRRSGVMRRRWRYVRGWPAIEAVVRSMYRLINLISLMRLKSSLRIRSMFTVLDPGSPITLIWCISATIPAATTAISMIISSPTSAAVHSSTRSISPTSSIECRSIMDDLPWTSLDLSVSLNESQNKLEVFRCPYSALRLHCFV